jgi:hypothetical protein
MEMWALILTVGSLLGATAAFIWLAASLNRQKAPGKSTPDLNLLANKEAEHIFSNEFREELRNRGRLHFEKIITENAMFLQQDLRMTAAQVNQFMKDQITKTLKEEFAKYEQSITDAKQLATEALNKTQVAIEQQHQILSRQLQTQVAEEKQRLMARFEENMSDIVNHYVLASIGNQIDLSDQLEFIIGNLEANKQAIVEDIKNGA